MKYTSLIAALALVSNAQQVVDILGDQPQANDAKKNIINLDFLEDNRGNLHVEMGSDLTVVGPENRSTGYMWAVNNECGARLNQTSDDYGVAKVSEGADLIYGKGGERKFVFSTPASNSNSIQGEPCKVTFTYKRPWLLEADNAKDVKTLTVTVGGEFKK